MDSSPDAHLPSLESADSATAPPRHGVVPGDLEKGFPVRTSEVEGVPDGVQVAQLALQFSAEEEAAFVEVVHRDTAVAAVVAEVVLGPCQKTVAQAHRDGEPRLKGVGMPEAVGRRWRLSTGPHNAKSHPVSANMRRG